MKTDKSVRISKETYKRIKEIRKNTGLNIKYIITKAIMLLKD